MRILLTGVTGQIGSILAQRLGRIGSVVSATRSEIDLSNIGSIPASLDSISPDVIINPAAYTLVDRAEDEPSVAFAINAEAPTAMAIWAAPRNVPIVHFSTDYVFDGSGSVPWREDDLPNPLSIYGRSKLDGELGVRHAGGPHLIVRCSWIYHDTGTNFLRTIARLAKDREELRVVDDQIGAPTSARLIGDVLGELVEKYGGFSAVAGVAGGTLHLAAGGETSWHGFASAVVIGLRARGLRMKAQRVIPISSSEFSTKVSRPRNSRFDLRRATSLLGRQIPAWQTCLEQELDRLAASAG